VCVCVCCVRTITSELDDLCSMRHYLGQARRSRSQVKVKFEVTWNKDVATVASATSSAGSLRVVCLQQAELFL